MPERLSKKKKKNRNMTLSKINNNATKKKKSRIKRFKNQKGNSHFVEKLGFSPGFEELKEKVRSFF